jgi:hypothetical protein
MAKRTPRRAKAAKAAAKKSTRAAKSRKSAARRTSAKRPSARKTARKAAKKSTRAAVARKSVKRAAKKKAAKKRAPAAKSARAPRRPPTLDRSRKTVDIRPAASRARTGDEGEPHGLPSSLDLERPPSAARSGRKEMTERLREHTSTGPAITAGDVDADWEDAESVGDEAPGGDNPTPDQDVVDDIGRALGVEYDDEEELKGGDEIAKRDRHRWELDPASSDDFDERD